MFQPLDLAVAFVLVVIASLVGLSAAKALIRLIRARRVGREALPALVVVVTGGALGAYAHWGEPQWPEIRTVPLVVPGGPVRDVLRVVQISDLHSEPVARLETRLPGLVAGLRPDLIVFTGDALNTPAGLPVFQGCMRALARVAPTYAVQGNWDRFVPDLPALFAGTGVVELDGQVVHHRVRGVEVAITGAPIDESGTIARATRALPAGGVRLFAYHSPDAIEAIAGPQVDLCMVGHTHGGQLALPLYGAVVVPSRFGRRYQSGRYQAGPTWLYVNRGIGMEHHVPFRFAARPEITCYELRGPG